MSCSEWMKTHEKQDTTSYFPQSMDIGDVYINLSNLSSKNYTHKIRKNKQTFNCQR